MTIRSRVRRKSIEMRKKMPGTVTTTVTPRNAGDTSGSDLTVKRCEKRVTTKDERLAAGEVAIESEMVTWMIWKIEISGGTVERGWIVTESDGTRWKIMTVDKELLGERFRCPAIRVMSSS